MASEEHDNERPRLTTSPVGAGAPGSSASEKRALEPASGGGIRRFPGFLKASWAELQRVRWPDRTQVAQGTGVVIVFVLIAGAFLGGVDALASQLVELVI
jgi:preprotein translocase subunit SecE